MKKRVLIDVKIECDPPTYIWWGGDLEYTAGKLENWVKEFHNFIRDHRSQDPVYLNVNRIYEEQCSFCGYKWDEDTETGEPFCCEKAVEEWKKEVIT